MTDTVQNPATENTTGNESANAAPAADNANEGVKAPEAAAPQSEGANETSANPNDKNTPQEGDGKVTDADKDKAADDGSKEGGDQNQKLSFEFDKLKLPNGFTVTDDQKAEFTKDAQTLGIKDQEGAQRFVDWIMEKAGMANSEIAKQQEKEMGDLESRWLDAGKKDPVLGKDYDKNVTEAMRTAEQLFSPQVIDFLKDTRFDKNPEFLKDLLRISKERADAALISGQRNTVTSGIKRDSQGNPMLKFK